MKTDRPQLKVMEIQPDKRAKPYTERRGRVKGLSAACKKKMHSSCFSLSCKCIHHQNYNKKDIKYGIHYQFN